MSEDRTQPPSKRRRQLAREQGQAAHSPELTAAAGWLRRSRARVRGRRPAGADELVHGSLIYSVLTADRAAVVARCGTGFGPGLALAAILAAFVGRCPGR